MKKFIVSAMILTLLSASHGSKSIRAEDPAINIVNDSEDSTALMFQDMLMLFLLPHIDKKIDEIYADILTYSPEVYPYFVDVIDMQRINGFRGFHFRITLEVHPTVGPHIPVGLDILYFDISPKHMDHVRLWGWRHVKGPQKSDFPPNWMDILKR
ncbi:hypothetical protein D3C84_606670 [compost metagenome]